MLPGRASWEREVSRSTSTSKPPPVGSRAERRRGVGGEAEGGKDACHGRLVGDDREHAEGAFAAGALQDVEGTAEQAWPSLS